MGINETLKRINELAHKKKSGIPLTDAELAEKKELYAEYLGFIRNQVKSQLDRIEFVDEVPDSNNPVAAANNKTNKPN
ncbi:MAG: DUF896 domain-containing protein [Veillonella sp.]|uniref:DUF896 domain-containing protein n=1 Tax=Veillonella sp. TaxID=1926307 RepID=UPI0025F8A185|nr:DUF896 domain-containing protein [Veillonella sp.]MBS4913760.1 DUF896 domain-containing protein [Veillonella sp.]